LKNWFIALLLYADAYNIFLMFKGNAMLIRT